MLGDPNAPIQSLKGVGPALNATLGKLGIFRTGDLLLHLPSRYQDRTQLFDLRGLRAGDDALVQGQIVDAKLNYGRRRSLSITLEDGSGFLALRFFYFSKSQQAQLAPGMYMRCFGEVRFGNQGLEMVHPEYQLSAEPLPAPIPELLPVYPTTQGLGQPRLRKLTAQLCDMQWPQDPGWPFADLVLLHRPPPDGESGVLQEVQQATQRVAVDELTAYYLIMRRRQKARAKQLTIALPQAQSLGRELQKNLGFTLTGAQKRVTTEVLEDLTREQPMLRLIQGDVGSGKTVIAAFATIRAAEHGLQTAVMAPTELLAEQHYLSFSQWLDPLGIQTVLLTGQQKAKERNPRLAAIEQGQALVAVGTHALFQESVVFHDLALTIIDEQHRFGVHQRMALRNKGRIPHQLIMTATPIPRTLTMALYADMDVSLIDELPAGRQPITTRVVSETKYADVLELVNHTVASGQQVYWVCTLIEPSEQLSATAAEDRFAQLCETLPHLKIGLLHGRLSSVEKNRIMGAFKAGELHLMVSTTVIEVGVDVGNATLMVIEDPDRLGLAQLHQLRGRVGRSELPSQCVLLYQMPLSANGQARLKVMRESQDGFYIAEQDLKLRGPGELLGTRQTGDQQFRVADLNRDAHLIPLIVERSDQLLAEEPETVQRLLDAWAPADTSHINV